MKRLPFLLLLCPLLANAGSADRAQPMNIEADHAVAVLESTAPTTLNGNVVITQGSMRLEAEKGVLHPRQGDIVRAVFEGAPVKLNQLMDDGTPMDAVARGVDYDLSTETVVFTGGVVIKRPGDVLEGERVVYNLSTGQVNASGPEGSRVKMRIAPKSQRQGAGSASGASAR